MQSRGAIWDLWGRARSMWTLVGLLCLVAPAGCSDDSGGENKGPDAAQQAVCGNGIREEGEECDEGADNSDLEPNACRSDCRFPRCGDGVADEGEDCDGRDYADKTCQDLVDPEAPSDWPEADRHFTGGHLACTEDCRLDLSGCTRCGNGMAEEGEECDGSDLANQDCASVANKQDGALSCTPQCTLVLFDKRGSTRVWSFDLVEA